MFFQDHALQVRLQHIVHCVEHKEWPVGRNFSAYSGGSVSTGLGLLGDDHDTPDATCTPTSTPRSVSEGSEVITITTDHSRQAAHSSQSMKRKRHIAIDVETERGTVFLLINIQIW